MVPLRQKTTIEWINHAGFVTKHQGVALVSDPWLDGPAFNWGWSLIAPTRFKPQDFMRITHIWFSHEHPDHFSPKNIREIPAELRSTITVLFQKTRDGKVIKFCRELGFKTVELESSLPYRLAPDFTIWCYRYPDAHRVNDIDSFLLVEAGTTRLLNFNDYCPRNSAELCEIKEQCGAIDVLFTQFSYATWVGNPGDEASKMKAAQQKVASMLEQIAILKPQFVVPFASYIFFANVENFHVNSQINKIGEVYNLIKERTTAIPVVLYPGDEWTVGETSECDHALSRYAKDLQKALATPPPFEVCKVSVEQLMVQAEQFRRTMLKTHSALILCLLIPSTTIWVKDYEKAFQFNYRSGLREQPAIAEAGCDISLVSGALSFCFTTFWGPGTLAVNGCFLSPNGSRHNRFFSCMAPSGFANAGVRVDLAIASHAAWRKIRVVLSRALNWFRV
jgi:UDP-MurNAc hydroxylase